MARLESPFCARLLAIEALSAEELERFLSKQDFDPADDAALAERLLAAGFVSKWQLAQVEAGRSRSLRLDHFRLIEPVGVGGMGHVFRARDLDSQSDVALKLLPRKLATPTALARFHREGKAALALCHDNVVRTFALTQHEDTHFLVMELIDGMDLRRFIAKKRRLSVQRTAQIGKHVARALAYAHARGVIHRDIKPSNILLQRSGHAKLADLGLAKFFDPRSESRLDITLSGQMMGTLDYLAPEQAEDAKRADERSDIYSLGCTLYACLVGKPPFHGGSDIQKLIAHRECPPAPIAEQAPGVSLLFADLIERRMLAKLPEQRFQTAEEVAESLRPWSKGSESEAIEFGSMSELLEEWELSEFPKLGSTVSMARPSSTVNSRSMPERQPTAARPRSASPTPVEWPMTFKAWAYLALAIVLAIAGVEVARVLYQWMQRH